MQHHVFSVVHSSLHLPPLNSASGSPARVKKEGWWWDADTATVNTEIWKAKGKVMDTNMGKSRGYQSQSQ